MPFRWELLTPIFLLLLSVRPFSWDLLPTGFFGPEGAGHPAFAGRGHPVLYQYGSPLRGILVADIAVYPAVYAHHVAGQFNFIHPYEESGQRVSLGARMGDGR